MLRNDFEGEKKSVLKALEAVCLIRSGDDDGHDADADDLMAMKNAGSSSSYDDLLKHAASARGRYFILQVGGVEILVNQLRMAQNRGNVSTLHNVCRLLMELSKNGDCAGIFYAQAAAIGVAGGHPVIKKLMSSDNEDLMEMGEEIAARCSVTRGGLPLRTLTMENHIHLPREMVFSLDKQSGKDQSTATGELVTLIGSVTDRMGSQSDTGYIPWPAATILARWIVRNSECFVNQTVMEVGAGLGICGLVAGAFAKEVYLTDYNATVLEAVERNVQLNLLMDQSASKLSSPALARPDGIKVRWLDWDCVEEISATTPITEESSWQAVDTSTSSAKDEDKSSSVIPYMDDGEDDQSRHPGDNDDTFGRPCWSCPRLDVIIGSDVICDGSCATGVARLLSLALKKDGVAYVTAPLPQHRFGIDKFPAKLKDHGLVFEKDEITDQDLLVGLPESEYMRFNLFTIRIKPLPLVEQPKNLMK